MKYDVIVVGAGAGGGVAAFEFAHAGLSVLLLERGGALTLPVTGRDHLRNQRLAVFGHSAGPSDDHPRVWQNDRGQMRTVLPWEGNYHANAAGIGSGTVVYGAQAWRFHPLDFKMATTYGVPEGSSLADWPIAYEDLAPHYTAVEQGLGVAARASDMTHLPDAPAYPLPAMDMVALNRQGITLRAGAKNLGWHTLAVPLAINTVPHDNRPACIHCQHCVGFACPVDAKNGTQNTYIPRALSTGNCRLLSGAVVLNLTVTNGRVTGVTYVLTNDPTPVHVEAETVVLAAGAIETARLLLLAGLGGETVGQNLHGHYYPAATGLFEHDIYDGIGPGVTTATVDFNHGNEDEDGPVIGGGMLADDFIPLPLSFWKGYTPPDIPRWGIAAKHWMRDNHRRVMKVMGPLQDIPYPEARVTLDNAVRDKWGVPVARLQGAAHPETVRAARFMHARAVEWLRASGAVQVWGVAPGSWLSGGQHQAGTCRMGDDPKSSVVNARGQVHGHPNLLLADAAVHVTNGGFNPFLTVMALAHRTARLHLRG